MLYEIILICPLFFFRIENCRNKTTNDHETRHFRFVKRVRQDLVKITIYINKM